MKKLLATFTALTLVLALGAPALAESNPKTLSLSGYVVPGETVSIKANFGGMMEDYTLRAGDTVEEGEALFEIATTKLYAPMDGVITGLFAAEGDEASYVQNRYGALLYIEPDSRFVIHTDVSEAYDSNENRIVHIGETVYLVSTNNSDRTGVGFVTAVDGKSFSVEVTEGNLRFDEKVTICRSEDHASSSRIGRGKTERAQAEAITGDGSVLMLHVQDGDTVKKGDLLAETVVGSLDEKATLSNVISSSNSGVIAAIFAERGAEVAKDQVLATLYPADNYQVAVDVNEMDLGAIAVGDSVQIEFLFDSSGPLVNGTIAGISALSTTETGDAEYTVYIDFDADESIRQGMSATVYMG